MGTCAQACYVGKSEQSLVTIESQPQRDVEVDTDNAEMRPVRTSTPTFMDCEATSHSELPPQPSPMQEEMTGLGEEEGYEGEKDEEGRRHGRGVCVWPDGKRYCGEWRHGVISGTGEMTWPDGRSYEGQFEAGVKQGTGTFRWKDGRKYEGDWEDDFQHGHGVFTSADGEQVTGVWVFGKRK